MTTPNKKIVISINTSWNIINFRLNLLKYLQTQGYQIIAFAPIDKYSKQFKKNNILFEPLTMENKGNNPIKDILLLKQYHSLLKKHKPDVALFFTIKPNIYGTLAATLLKIPVINNVSGLGTTFIHQNWISRTAHILYKYSFKFSKKVFFQNKDDEKLFIGKKLINAQITEVLPGSGVDLKKFTPSQLPEKLHILFIGRLLFDKGIVEFLESCKAIKAIHGKIVDFSIIGKLEESHKLGISEQILRQYTTIGAVTYLGTTDKIREEIAKASVIILPSYREGTPRSLLEAAAMSRPLLATNVPGCKDIIREDYNGWLCKEKDTKDLTLAIEKVIQTDKKKLIEFGSNSRTLVEQNYGEQLVFEKYNQALKDIL